VIVLGSPSLASTLTGRFASEKTSLGEPVQVIPLESLDRDVGFGEEEEEIWAQHTRERAIKEYFFGSGRRTLSPQIQQVDFDAVVVYRYGDCKPSLPSPPRLRLSVI
jgi:polyribonucleotide 5'-hydroxyl-kinase